MLNHGYLAQTLRRPLPTKDGGTLHTVADAANYIVALPEDRRRTHWDRAAQLLLDLADASELSRQLELALFYDRQLNLKMPLLIARRPSASRLDHPYRRTRSTEASTTVTLFASGLPVRRLEPSSNDTRCPSAKVSK